MIRDSRLRKLSSDHHHALVLARMVARRQTTWTADDSKVLQENFTRQLAPHFNLEETILLPALQVYRASDLALRTLHDHTELRRLFNVIVNEQSATGAILRELSSLMVDHVRFEERVVFLACEELLPDLILSTLADVSS